MIAIVSGILEEKSIDTVVVMTSGIGFSISVPESVALSLPAVGQTVKLYTYLHVREDAMSLFGFSSTEQKEMFLKLLTVSGVGPKVAMAVLSKLSTKDLVLALASGDAKLIATAPGVGKKTAERIILELRNHAGKMVTENFGGQAQPAGNEGAKQEAIQGLIALGYSPAEALEALASIGDLSGKTVEDIIFMALKKSGMN